MTAKKLLPGATVALRTSTGSPIEQLLIGAHWSHTAVDIDMCCLLLGSNMRVLGKEYFLFRNQRVIPERTGFLRYLSPQEVSGPDRAQIILDLVQLPQEITRAVLAMSVLRRGGVLAEMGTLRTRAMDMASSETVYLYTHVFPTGNSGACMTLWELERRNSGWGARITGRPYPGGPPALVRDYGAR